MRSAWVTLAPITVWMTLVSVVRRDSTSPVRVTSKKPGEQVEDVAVDVAPQVGDDPLAQPGDEVGAQVGRDGEHHDDDAHGLDRVVERVRLGLGEAAVDQVAQADAEREHGGRGQDQGDQRPDDVAAIGAEIGGEPAQLAEVAARLPLGPEPCQRAGALLHPHPSCGALAGGDDRPLPRPLSERSPRLYTGRFSKR